MKVIIIGGGACGCFAAITIKKNNPAASVTVLEQNSRVLKKLGKTGSGKCNIANVLIDETKYNDFRYFRGNGNINITEELGKLGILLKETTMGRIYPYDESAKTAVNVLLRNLEASGVEVITDYCVTTLRKKKKKFIINNELESDFVIVATGSVAREKTCGYSLLAELGHRITELRPGLVPLLTAEKTASLEGIRFKCRAMFEGRTADGEIQFRKDGLSGILVLDLSRFVKDGDIIYFDLMPEYEEEEVVRMLKRGKTEDVLMGIFPKMLALDLIKRGGKKVLETAHSIKNYRMTVTGRKGFDEAQIVLGGVSGNDVNDDFSSKIVKNMFIGGEVLDVDGASGGYNLCFAWLSGIVIGSNRCFKS